MSFLQIEGLTKDFDGYKAVNNVSLAEGNSGTKSAVFTIGAHE